jgi:zinc/manganese transport system substrate-binding protein
MVRVSRASLYLEVGLGLDGWAAAVVAGSRNARLTVVNCAAGVQALDRPAGPVSAAMGDVHPEGNPHYWLDPRNGAIVARTVAAALGRADPPNAALYASRAEAFGREAHAAYERGRALAAALPSRTLLTYHASWVYLADAFDLELAGTVEPKPGIPPTARHLAGLVATAKARGVKVLLQEPYFSNEAGRFLAREAGVRVEVVSPSCDSPAPGAYLAHLETVLRRLGGGALR